YRSKCLVCIVRKSNDWYCTLFWPKYCAVAVTGTMPRPPATNAAITVRLALARTRSFTTAPTLHLVFTPVRRTGQRAHNAIACTLCSASPDREHPSSREPSLSMHQSAFPAQGSLMRYVPGLDIDGRAMLRVVPANSHFAPPAGSGRWTMRYTTAFSPPA